MTPNANDGDVPRRISGIFFMVANPVIGGKVIWNGDNDETQNLCRIIPLHFKAET